MQHIYIYIYIYIYIGNLKILSLLSFGFCPKFMMNSANVVAEIHLKLLNKRALSTGEPCTCEYAPVISQRYIKYILVYSSNF